jgi:hypothetical protein
MKKQTNSFKFILLFFFCSFGLSEVGYSLDNSQTLLQADSLFDQKKYTESFLLYESLYDEQMHSTPRMYLRMAFIKEGLGNYSEALFFLNEYFLRTSDKNVQGKMKEIAIEQNLNGFEINDKTFFVRQLRIFYNEISIAILTISILVFFLIIYLKYKKGVRSIPLGFILIVLLAALYYLFNYGKNSNEGIITENHAYIMTGPSSGSNLIEVIKNGHKVKIIEEASELWMVIEWNGKKGYIRKSKLKRFS